MLQKFATQIDLRKAAALALVVGLAACAVGALGVSSVRQKP